MHSCAEWVSRHVSSLSLEELTRIGAPPIDEQLLREWTDDQENRIAWRFADQQVDQLTAKQALSLWTGGDPTRIRSR